MTPPKKPEWFEIADSDGGKPQRKIKRGVRALALTVPLLAIGIGVVLAQSSDESPANAESVSVTASAQPSIAASEDSSKIVSAPTQPSIAKPPTNSGDDGEFEGEHKRGEHHEGGEHEDFGDDD
ncbi:MAG: hypothetical protein ACR2I6_05200 [Candidatus Planktophila sp.]